MNSKRILTYFIASFILIEMFYFFSIPIAKANGEIPEEYYQGLKLNGTYVYNITQFGGDAEWLNFSGGSEGFWSPNSGGQIIVNFTGFYDRDPDDLLGDLFPDTNMSWLDIEIYKNTTSGLQLNYTQYNISTHEVAKNLILGYSGFQSGFLVPINDFSWLKNIANTSATGADLTIDETFNFISFHFKQNGGDQNTFLIYERFSGLLIQAETEIQSQNYKLEMFLTNYSLDFSKPYYYDVTKYGGPLIWQNFSWVYIGLMVTNPGGYIEINFNGYYEKDPNDVLLDVFTNPNLKRAWLDMEVFYEGDFGNVSAFVLNNASNREYSNNMLLGYMTFLSGFLIPDMSNETFLREKAIEQSNIFGNEADVSVKETNLTLRFKFIQTVSGLGGPLQFSDLIYEKRTGLLLWTYTYFKEYMLEINLRNYVPWQDKEITDDDDDNGDETPPLEIPSFPIIILFGILMITCIIIIIRIKGKNIKIRN